MNAQNTPHAPDQTKATAARELPPKNEQSNESQQRTSIGSYIFDLATGAWKVSPELYKIFGVDETHLQTLEGWVSLLRPDSQGKCTEYHSQVESKKTRFDHEYRITRINDGVERWVHGFGEIEYDRENTAVRRIGTVQDITERKQEKEHLRLTQTTMDRLSEAIFWVDPDARFLYVNDAACRLLGYSKEELLSLAVPDVDPNFPAESWPAHWAELKQRGSFSFESAHRTKEGTTLQTEVTVNYLQVDGKEYNCAIMRDITERKRTEEALRESEVRCRLLTEATFDGIAIHDQGILVEVNSGLEKMFGYGPGELIGKHVLDLVADESREMAMDNMRRGVSGPYESVGRRKDGSTFFGEVIAKSYRHNGREVRLVAGRDITERKRAEKALQAGEERYRALYDDTPTMYFTLATDGTVLSVNRFGAKQLGYRVEELVGHSVLDVFYEEDKKTVAANLSECLTTPETPRYWEFRKVRKDGTVIWVQETVHVGQSSSGETVVLVTCEDITARKQTEDRLRRTQYAVDHATDYIFVIGHDGYFLDVNESACRRLGYAKEELLAKSVMDIDPDFSPAVWKTFWDEFKRMKLLRLETRHRSKSGEIYPVEVVANYILHEGKELDYAFVRDISERKRAEVSLRTFQEQISQMQKMEAIGQLAGGIAHDFNNILTAILGNAEIACAKTAADHPSRQNLTTILEAGNRASRLVQQILTFTHQQAFSRTVLPLSPVVDEVLTLLRATLPAGIELTGACDAATPPVLADATQIHQVLLNLCTNAWHALGKQSGSIAIDLAPATLIQALHSLDTTLPPGSYACLSVRDTGCGMASDVVARIFDPFFTTKPFGQGTGLGLSVVHGIVRGHEGAILVDSHPGQGTTMKIYFPAAEMPAHRSEPIEAAPVQTQDRCRHILYLDDEAMLVELVRAWFEPRGYRVTGCIRATEALDAVRADPAGFDVILTDHTMPEMSGIDLAQALAHIRGDLPVVLVSGHLPSALPADANIKAMVSKPAMWQQLEDVIVRLLDTPPPA